MWLPFSLQSLSSQLNTPIFTSPLQFTNHRDTTIVFKTKNQLPICNHHGLLLSSSPDSNQYRSPSLRLDGGAILKLSWRQGLAATHPAYPVPPCLVIASENKINPNTPNTTNKRQRNSSPGPSNGKINVPSQQQDQVSHEMKTASKEEHDHVSVERNSLNDPLSRINEEINEIKNHVDLLKGELDKLLSYLNCAIRTDDQVHGVKGNKYKEKLGKKANTWLPPPRPPRPTIDSMRGNKRKRGSLDDTDDDKRRVKPRLE